MGCSNSKVDNEEGVARCKQRKRLMKQTLASRHHFASSHALFVMSLRGVGAAFRQFAEGEGKDGETHGLYPPGTPTTPMTPPLSLGPPPSIHPTPPPISPSLSSVFSPSPPNSPPLSKLTSSSLRFHRGSPSTRAASSPESTMSMDFLPPPPPPIIVKEYRMEHTPPVIPTKIYRFDDTPGSNSYMPKSGYVREDSPPPPPMIQPVQNDDDWRYSGQARAPQVMSQGVKESAPPPPPRVVRSSWQDLFMDPFRPAPPTFNYVEQQRNHEAEVGVSSSQHLEQSRKQELLEEQKRKHDEQRKVQERLPPKVSREKSPERLPSLEESPQKSVDLDVPDLEEDDIPELEDVEEDVDVPALKDLDDGKDNKAVKKPQLKPEPKLKSEPEPEPEPDQKPEAEPEPEPKTPSKTPPRTPQKIQEKPPKAAKPARTPTPGKPGGKPPKPEQREEVIKTNQELALVKVDNGGRDLLDVLKEVDDCFLKAAESGEDVSRMLETKKAHYHSSFSDNLRVVGESARMSFRKLSGKSGSPGMNNYRTSGGMSVLTDESASIMSMKRSSNINMSMNMSMRNLGNLSSARWSEECGLTGSHAATLDRLFAWEKKLCLEVKEAEALRVELERKYSLFRNQDAKNEDQTIIDKTRANIKALQTRMVVSIQAVDSAAQQVQKIRDEELYPQLLELLEGMGNMWREMSACHQTQLRAVEAIKRLDNSAACEQTTSSHRHSTTQLELALNKWSESLNRYVHSQKDYLKNLTTWLRLSLMQFGSEEAERSGSRSPSRSPRSPLRSTSDSPIYAVCSKWLDSLDQLADRVVLEAIGSFAAVVREMLRLQWEELRIKKRVETYLRELEKREHALMNASMRDPGMTLPPPVLPQTPSTTSGSDLDDSRYDVRSSDGRYDGGRYDIVPHREFTERTEVADKRVKMEATRRKLDDELELERKAYTDTRLYTLNSLQAGLPQLFQAIIVFSNQEADIYDKINTPASTPQPVR